MIREMQAAIFDLDGVIVDTAKYHYLAWKRLAYALGFDFTERDNERLKGVSRQHSLEILLEIGQQSLNEEEKQTYAAMKNDWYVEYIQQLHTNEILPGVTDYIEKIRNRGVKTAIGSASKNTPLILERLGIRKMFDSVVDGNKVSKAKPDPEVFLRAAAEIKVIPQACVVFEDAEAGIEAALRAGMGAVGIGRPASLIEADAVIEGIWQLLIL
ncbi:MAG: beta-phosphoglucomutase [Anaerolineaceae bacterium]|nr:beta-phosphoglucomutase [Anaerolineaceae bacterium]